MAEVQLEFDRSLLGKSFPAGSFEITAETIRAYCRATGDANPLSNDEAAARAAGHPGLLAPPTLYNLFIRGLNRPNVRLQNTQGGFHGGQALDVLASVHAGDTLTAVSRLKEVYAKTGRTGTMAFTVWETEFTNQRGQVVARGRESFMSRLRVPEAEGSKA
jgi:acyl dehydratase